MSLIKIIRLPKSNLELERSEKITIESFGENPHGAFEPKRLVKDSTEYTSFKHLTPMFYIGERNGFILDIFVFYLKNKL